MNTIICTAIKDEKWEAWTPHSPKIIARAEAEHSAVNVLVHMLRDRFRDGIEWDENATPPSDPSVITRNLTGLWPNLEQIITKSAGDDVGPTVEQTS